MANLPETPQWEDGIYQIEVSDPVLGGPDGISNRQGKQLASRTLYLKQQVEKGGSDLAKHIAAADPHTQYAPKASPTFTGTPTAPTPANSDNSKKLATTEFVARALAALAGSAPETLDTLKELADALGNDPNFATTVLNKLAEKLAKDQNGADIPDPALFVKNLGLGEKFSGRFIGHQIFTTPGAINYKPTPGTKRIKIILTGGGGRGYGYLGWGSGFTSRGAGGGAGGTCIALLNVDDTKTYPCVVGCGSDQTISATSSTFNGMLTAGNGVNASSGDAGGPGGTAVGGDLNIQGGDGSDAPGIISTSTNPYRGGSGDGGVSYWGGGKRSVDGNLSVKGKTFGAGGGGNTRSDPFIGNYGSDGVIYIEEYS